MEGLIPLVYNAIVQYRNGGGRGGPLASSFESPSASYMRLPGDSGRFQVSDNQVFGSDSGSAAQIILSTGVHHQSPMYRFSTTTRRMAA